jgi:hypothetical protein
MPEPKLTEVREQHEEVLQQTMESELSDEQLQQLAEGASSWGANCNKNGSC